VTDTQLSVVVLGSLQFLVALLILWQVILSRASVAAMKAAYLEGYLRFSVVPRGVTGLLNMRLENSGQGVVDEVKLVFPSGLRVITTDTVQTVAKKGTIWELGSMGPGEKREWHIGFAGHKDFAKLGDKIEYVLHYRRVGNRKETIIKGSLSLKSYTGTLVRAYADQEDFLRESEKLVTAVQGLSKQLSEVVELLKRSSG